MNIPVKLGKNAYDIHIASSYQPLAAALKRVGCTEDVRIITHRRLLNLHGKSLLAALRKSARQVEIICVPESERSKTLEVFERVQQQMAKTSRMRAPWVVAFGGGVIGDLAGFVAATYRRGVPVVQVPTTLLAQVDASIGGKTGLDLPQGKNLVGAYHQPALVFNNTSVLKSLPKRHRQTGLAEVIKYGVIADPVLFRYLEKSMQPCLLLQPAAVQLMVKRSCAIKARIVAKDEREGKGPRLHLNFGHTLGHALEAESNYERWTHGEAVAIGMCAATWMAVELGLCSQRSYDRIERVIKDAGLPVKAGNVRAAAVLKALKKDKKFIAGKPRWVLPSRIGRVAVSENVPMHLVAQAIRRFSA